MQRATNNNAISLSSNLCDAADVIAAAAVAAAAYILHVPFYTPLQLKHKGKRKIKEIKRRDTEFGSSFMSTIFDVVVVVIVTISSLTFACI